jgi:hypothetical protein
VTLTEILTIVAVAVVLLGLAWYFVRGRQATSSDRGNDVDAARERQRAAAAAEDARTDAMVRRYCPHCGVEREVRAGACVECGYRFG